MFWKTVEFIYEHVSRDEGELTCVDKGLVRSSVVQDKLLNHMHTSS